MRSGVKVSERGASTHPQNSIPLTFHNVRIPCSAACSSNFRICSADNPALSACWSLSNTCFNSIADRTVDTLKISSLPRL